MVPRGRFFDLFQEKVMAGNLAKIQHLVVVMLENRSFDNMLGFLYTDQGNVPPRNLPALAPATFDGLLPNSDAFWNPANPDFFSVPGTAPQKVAASSGTTGAAPFTVPDPDPNEQFPHFNFQIFGTQTPADGQQPTMLGFLVDYLIAAGNNLDTARRVMQSYSPDQVPVLSQLARSYAVCDRWFASVPAQTWPNRGFMHTGTACGQVSNSGPFAYNTETIYEVLQKTGHSWGVYKDTALPSLVKLQYPRLGLFPLHFHQFSQFKIDAKNGTLPSYSFVEPSFAVEPEDQHPPHNVTDGERFLAEVWAAVSTGAHWPRTLLVITYDEHGGCYDHVPPPWGAVIPDAASNPGAQGFRFNRFGVRVPAVVISPLTEAGTVFRSPTGVPFDHTSVLATLRDWLAVPDSAMLPSQRIKAAPTLEFLITRDQPRDALPAIAPLAHPLAMLAAANLPARPVNDLQLSMIAAVEAVRRQRELSPQEVEQLRQRVPTVAHMAQYFKEIGLTNP
jgi:phospholipase C